MVDVLQFYMDDSGTRHPDRKPGKKAAHGRDWFALGGILVKESDEHVARGLYEKFCASWPQVSGPLHSSEIRGKNEGFLWLRELKKNESERFYEELYHLLKAVPVLGLACVIDRPGYNARYKEIHGLDRWLLCKTAFSVSVERAAKYAQSMNYKLRVMPERCNKPEDRAMKSYYERLRTDGMPFQASSSDKYAPLSAADLKETLYEFRTKKSTSPMAQLADLYLWPMAIGGYHPANRAYARLKEDGKLIECVLPEEDHAARATKYSCFELVRAAEETQKPELASGLEAATQG